MPDSSAWISAVRTSHERAAALLGNLSAEQVRAPSYASEWSIADVASHLGSQAEIFELFLASGLSGDPAPGGEVFQPIWDRWNALPPAEQAAQSVAVNASFVEQLEQIPDDQARAFSMSMFGREVDLGGLLAMRLGEHALHTWDIAVALDPEAKLSIDAVDLLVDALEPLVARAGQPVDGGEPITITTTDPQRHFVLTVSPEVSLAESTASAGDALELPAEALVRLVYGRLDAEHAPDDVADDPRVVTARAVFPGF
jgi:uncharacterized protein (TIGR03083 family)